MLKFLIRLSLRVISFCLIQLPLQIIGIMVLLIVLPIKRYRVFNQIDGHYTLPNCLKFFDCADFYVKRDTSTYLKVFLGPFWTHYTWLAFRNPCNYFEYVYLGFQFKPKTVYTIKGALNVGNQHKDVDGLKIIELQNGDGNQYYEYLYVKRYSLNNCFYFRLGHKIKDRDNKDYSYCQHVFTISPFKSYDI